MNRILPAFFCAALVASACSHSSQKKLASLPDGGAVTFTQVPDGGWGLRVETPGKTALVMDSPVRIELSEEDSLRTIRAPYSHIARKGKTFVATAQVDAGTAAFEVKDIWSRAEEGVVTLEREVRVEGAMENAGFATSAAFVTEGEANWVNTDFFAPGLLYGDPTYDGKYSPGGTAFDEMHLFTFREDFLPAPMYAASFPDASTFTLLDSAPDATTTLEETRRGMGPDRMVDPVLATGSFYSRDSADGGIEIGFTFPSSTGVFPWRFRSVEAPEFGWCRRYNPVTDGYVQRYRLALRTIASESFSELTIRAYRWAWTVLKPQVFWHDIEQVRTCLSDQLSSLVTRIDDRTGLPYIVKTKSGQVWQREDDPAFYWRDPFGFVGKHIESACMLLMEGDRDTSERGAKMRQQGLDMISTALKYVDTKNPVCMGFNLMDGTHSMTNPPIWYVREGTDDMVRLLEAYEREKAKGIDHPEWVTWCRDFADWLLALQRPDGSLPRSFMIETAAVVEESGTTSYNIIPTFVKLTDILGDNRYLDSALRAAEYVWENFGKRGVFIGGAIDNPNITDKEAGLLSAEAFMFLYEKTGEDKWLERARAAADFAETWTWIWNVPMPDDADDEALNWKKGVPTVGVQGITAQVAGHTDQFLDMSIPTYMKLYKYTGDSHYFDFARILMHNCKAMLALPGRLYGMVAPGYQTENFRMGADRGGRGFGTPEKWMPWVTTNHLFGINMAEQLDKDLFDRLCEK